MGRIVVFDSGFGSLSIIKSIQKHTKSDIVYFADQKNYPYGTKSKTTLKRIIKDTITKLKKRFEPDLIVVGSNTPSLLFGNVFSEYDGVVGVFPPLIDAMKVTKTNSVAVLVTHSVAGSSELKNFIRINSAKNIKSVIIDSSDLVDLVESGKFITQQSFCKKKIISVLQNKIIDNNVDVATLSSTHLPFLLPMLQQVFPQIKFLDPADSVARQIVNHELFFPSPRNTLRIFSSGDAKKFQAHIRKLGIKNVVRAINF